MAQPPKKDNLFWNQLSASWSDLAERERARNQDPLNPNIVKQNNLPDNQSVRYKNNDAGKDFSWLWKSFDYNVAESNITLHEDIFKEADGPISFRVFKSDEGNLSVFDVPEDQIHNFSANIFSRQGSVANCRVNWSGDISVYVNGGLIDSSYENGFPNRDVALPLSSGYNTVSLFIRTKQQDQYFSINNKLGDFADDWLVPVYDNPLPPKNLEVQKTKPLNNSDSNVVVLNWDEPSDISAFGYKVERRGPFNTGLIPPVIIQAEVSGVYTSGAVPIVNSGIKLPVLYSISAVDSNGESLPSNKKLDYGEIVSGVALLTGYEVNTAGAALATGFTNYIVTQNTIAGEKLPAIQSIYVNNTENSVQLGWETDVSLNTTGYTVYRLSEGSQEGGTLSGYRLVGLDPDTKTYLDTGVAGTYTDTLSGLPPDQAQELVSIPTQPSFINNSYYLTWSGVTASDGGEVSYKVYRTFYSGFYESKSLVATTFETSYIDSGITVSGVDLLKGVPVRYKPIGSATRGVNRWEDTGLKNKGEYEYRVRSVNYTSNESAPSNEISVTAGDFDAPVTPSGMLISITSGFVTLTWQNGIEDDLAGTRVFQSGETDPGYTLIRETIETGITTFVGYGVQPHFALKNFNYTNNESDFTTGILTPEKSTIPVGGADFDALSGLFVPKVGDYDVWDNKTFYNQTFFHEGISLSGNGNISNTTGDDSINISPASGLTMGGGSADVVLNGGSTNLNINGGTQDLNITGGGGHVQILTGGDDLYIGAPGRQAQISGTLVHIRGIGGGTETVIIDNNGSSADVLFKASGSGKAIISGEAPNGIHLLGGSGVPGEGDINTQGDIIPLSASLDNLGSKTNPYATGFFEDIVAPLQTRIETSQYTIQYGDDVVLISGAGTTTVLLPSSPDEGAHYWIKNLSSTDAEVSGVTPLTLIDDAVVQHVPQYTTLHVVYRDPKWYLL